MQSGYPRAGCLTVQLGEIRIVLDPNSKKVDFDRDVRRVEEILKNIKAGRLFV